MLNPIFFYNFRVTHNTHYAAVKKSIIYYSFVTLNEFFFNSMTCGKKAQTIIYNFSCFCNLTVKIIWSIHKYYALYI